MSPFTAETAYMIHFLKPKSTWQRIYEWFIPEQVEGTYLGRWDIIITVKEAK